MPMNAVSIRGLQRSRKGLLRTSLKKHWGVSKIWAGLLRLSEPLAQREGERVRWLLSVHLGT